MSPMPTAGTMAWLAPRAAGGTATLGREQVASGWLLAQRTARRRAKGRPQQAAGGLPRNGRTARRRAKRRPQQGAGGLPRNGRSARRRAKGTPQQGVGGLPRTGRTARRRAKGMPQEGAGGHPRNGRRHQGSSGPRRRLRCLGVTPRPRPPPGALRVEHPEDSPARPAPGPGAPRRSGCTPRACGSPPCASGKRWRAGSRMSQRWAPSSGVPGSQVDFGAQKDGLLPAAACPGLPLPRVGDHISGLVIMALDQLKNHITLRPLDGKMPGLTSSRPSTCRGGGGGRWSGRAPL